ncbi:PITRM1 [Mytilus coruscus]|uniref:PITRM1 n=1 Tax=Mytilus coruscus TaxID=42192 RepID=A0A6J8ETL5_MYTCO|nr:PITRM1 [Mytilus coruscus]
MKTLAETDESAVITNVEKLQKIGQFLLNKNNIRFAINSTSEQMSSNQNKHGYFEPELVKTQFELPFSVNYMSKAVETVPYTHEDFPILRVLSRMMSAKYLHREISEDLKFDRMKEDNYRSDFSEQCQLKQLLKFKVLKWVVEDKFVPEDVDEAKLSVFQQTDKPITPGSAGMTLFLSGITDEMRQTMRDRLFHVSKQDVINVTKKYLTGDRPATVSFIGPENSTVKTDDTWKVMKG